MVADEQTVLGIDLGTTNSACAVVREGRASVVKSGDERIIPSVVAAIGSELIVGSRAKAHRTVDPTNVVYSAKRLIGRRYWSREVRRMAETVPYRIVEGKNESVMVELGDRTMSVVEISAEILGHLKRMAEEALGQRVHRAVISVPANFTESQRSATRVAGKLAGLDVIRVINEPTAAALAYGYIEDMDRRIAVYDFGGGTFDVTILQITRNVFEVLATSGEMFLGGDDLDHAIVERMAQIFKSQHGFAVEVPEARERLRAVAEDLKIQLSETDKTSVRIDEVVPGRTSDLEFSLSRREYSALVRPILERTVPVCEDALRVAGLSREQIDEVVLVGGTTRTPAVRELVAQTFGKPPQTSINPMSVVAVGAAIQGAALIGSLVPMAAGASSSRFHTDPMGSAVLLDVTPRSLGIRTVGGNVDIVIHRNSAIPCEQTKLFTTTKDNQEFVRLEVCQGESSKFDENVKLGQLVLSRLRPAPRGQVTIGVTFEINADGMLEVRAKDQETGMEQVASMKVLGGMADEDVQDLLSRQRTTGRMPGGEVAAP